jgi:mono/diheme cytochrome c family protein
MRRLAFLFGVSLLLAGCGGERTVSPVAKTVVGTIPTSTGPSVPAGNAKTGATLFKSQGCDGCHIFTPAGSNKTIGPDLDKLAQYAKQANRGSEAAFAFDSIKNPSAYIQPGYEKAAPMPNFGQILKDQQIADLVAYLAKG